MSIRGRPAPAPKARLRSLFPARRAARSPFVWLALAAVIAVSAAAAQPGSTAGDRLVASETTARVAAVHDLVNALTKFDDALITIGKDDLARHRRINRLIAVDHDWNGTGFDSTAVLAAVLDDLENDPVLAGSPLITDIRRARAFALERLVALLGSGRLPAADDRLAMRRLFDEASRPDSASIPSVNPGHPLPPARGHTAFLLEADRFASVPVPGAGSRTFLFLPGSQRVLSGDGTHLFVVDLVGGGAENIAEADAEPPPVISSSGEYIAFAVTAGDAREIRLLRRGDGSAPRMILSGRSVDGMAFAPRGLRLAAVVDGRLVLRDAGDGTVRSPGENAGDSGPGAAGPGSPVWSPDGTRVALIGWTSSGWPVSVFDALTGREIESMIHVGARPVWYADSRTLTSLAFTTSGDGEPHRAPVFDVRDTQVTGPAWSPDGRWAACRLSGDPVRGGWPPALRIESAAMGGLAGSAFLDARSLVRISAFPVPDSARFDPPTETLPEFAWHPSGRWYAARQDYTQGGGLWLFDTITGDAVPLGGPSASRPAFSPGGDRVLWLENTPAGERFAFRDLRTAHANLPRSRTFAAEGQRALSDGRFEDAARDFRNAARLAPDNARALQGLGRSLMGSAFRGAMTPDRAADLEAAVRAFWRAAESDPDAQDIRIDFLDASARMALVFGWTRSGRLVDEAMSRLKAPPPVGDTALRRRALEARAALLEAVLLDPDNAFARTLLDGVIARYGDLTP